MIKNRIFMASIVLASLVMAPASVWAQETFRHGYGSHMMNSGGGWSHMIFGPIFMIVIFVVVIALVVLLVRWLGGMGHGAQLSHHAPPGRTPLDILKERYARGEIDKEEFEERRSVLGE